MHATTMSIERIRRGSPIPSTPMWYRALMTGIHDLSTMNCSFPAWP